MMSTNSIITDGNSKLLQSEHDPMLMVYAPMSQQLDHPHSNMMMENASVPDLLAENSYNTDNQSGPSSAEEAVFPPTYAALPTTKLEEEPNPFEQSFESVENTENHNQQQQHNLPSFQVMETKYVNDQKSGILSPSTLSRHSNPNTTVYNSTFNTASDQHMPAGELQKRSGYTSNANSSCSEDSSFIISTPSKPTNKRSRKQKKASAEQPEDEEKRKNFLERNRIAALKCRQRKKQWLQNLQTKVEYLSADNDQYYLQANALRDEIIQLKTLLMIHKDCPLNKSAVQAALNRPIPGIFDASKTPHSALLRSTQSNTMTSSSSLSPPPSSSSTTTNITCTNTPI